MGVGGLFRCEEEKERRVEKSARETNEKKTRPARTSWKDLPDRSLKVQAY